MQKKVLVAALNWGLGHATRCVPIIRELEKRGSTPILASDGPALLLLQKEFPHLKTYELPSYDITYTSNGKHLKWKLLLHTPSILKTIKAEKKMTKEIVEEEDISVIISDSRFGTCYKHVRNIFITHQLNVLSGNTTFISTRIHRRYIEKFDECWVPDSPGHRNLSGILGHLKQENGHVKYLGPLSRFEKKDSPLIYEYLILLSGPEPQRSLLQAVLFKAFGHTSRKVLFVRGVLEEENLTCSNPNIEVKNYLYGDELEQAINSSRLVIARSGYTTILDLAKLEKKAFFIPTPGQFEQEYLAQRLKKLGVAPYCKQDDFRVALLEDIDEYSGLRDFGFTAGFDDIFAFLERK